MSGWNIVLKKKKPYYSFVIQDPSYPQSPLSDSSVPDSFPSQVDYIFYVDMSLKFLNALWRVVLCL